jgi:hypothetical protein
MTKVVRKVRFNSREKLDIYDEICTDLLDGKVPPLSTYRISLFLFGEWQEGQDLKFLTQLLKNILQIFHLSLTISKCMTIYLIFV